MFAGAQMLRRIASFAVIVLIIAGLLFPGSASAHNVSKRDAAFVQATRGPAIGPFLYLGAKHKVTGYDHLAFLVGFIFLLYKLKDIVQYVSLFTLGHSITLLGGVLGGIHANPWIIDAIIGLSVIYKAFDNMDGFKRLFGFEPDTKIAVLIFGLFHGFGLATKLQELDLARTGLITNIVSFNVGVEIGQVLALTAILIAFGFWRTRSGFFRYAFAANTALMVVGMVLLGCTQCHRLHIWLKRRFIRWRRRPRRRPLCGRLSLHWRSPLRFCLRRFCRPSSGSTLCEQAPCWD